MGPKYDQATLEAARDDYTSGICRNQREAAEKYGIPKSTFNNFMRGKNVGGKRGRCNAIPDAIECRLVTLLNFLAMWRVPCSCLEFREIVKSVLDGIGFVSDSIKENMPGRKWVVAFMKRKKIALRQADNVTAGKCFVGPITLNEYFRHLTKSLEGVANSSIFNYDETNLTDDPECKKVLVSRGMRRVERRLQHSKSSISMMFCSGADGSFLPPMVVHKGVILKDEWTIGGPLGTVYSMTRSGWFNRDTFGQWFEDVFMVYVRDHQVATPIALIGDNLPAHFSPSVIAQCAEHDIRFICLPANTTHLTQPLDVGVFAGMKKRWRAQLVSYRQNNPTGPLRKELFPSLLDELVKGTSPETIRASFKGAGISPLDPNAVLKKVPSKGNVDVPRLVEAFGTAIEERLDRADQVTPGTKRKRADGVIPGEAVTPVHLKKRKYFGDIQWICFECQGVHHKQQHLEPEIWLACDNCDLVWHLKCTELVVPPNTPVQELDFVCTVCTGQYAC